MSSSTEPDLNLLPALEVLLSEGSVAGAARRLGLSPSAMSRTLARLRQTCADPLLVRAGRGLVPTPRALEFRGRIAPLVREAREILGPGEVLDLNKLARTFTIRSRDGFLDAVGPDLVSRVAREAPSAVLRFVPKTSRDGEPLRQGSLDLDTGVVGEHTEPELMVRPLFRDRWIGVVRAEHPLCGRVVSAKDYAEGRHVEVSRRPTGGPLDDALAAAGLEHSVAAYVGDFAAAVALARGSDLIASLPERHTYRLRTGMHVFPLPFATPEITVSLIWHPRQDGDPAHQWLRSCVREVCAAWNGETSGGRPESL